MFSNTENATFSGNPLPVARAEYFLSLRQVSGPTTHYFDKKNLDVVPGRGREVIDRLTFSEAC